VEWEESAIDFLLDKGFTRDMGARPLRRAIEQYLLAPIAMSIVEHRFPEGDQFLFVRSDRNGIQVEFVDPDAEPAPETEPEPALAGLSLKPLILSAHGTEAERRFLAERLAQLEQRIGSDAWLSAKAAELEAMSASDFWNDPQRFATLSRIELMDRIAAGVEGARSIMRRLEHRADQHHALPASLLSSLAQQIYLLECALHDRDKNCASEVYLSIESVAGESAAARDDSWPHTLLAMYREWGRRRRMRIQLLHENMADGHAPPTLLGCSGFGVHGILQREAGLHVLEVPEADEAFQRFTARVRIAPQPPQPKPAAQSDLEFALSCFADQPVANSVVRRYRREPSPLVRDAVAGWRTGRLDQVLAGDFDVMT
jgi:ATP-dependent Clp protease ATP-binding subunit ClpC